MTTPWKHQIAKPHANRKCAQCRISINHTMTGQQTSHL